MRKIEHINVINFNVPTFIASGTQVILIRKLVYQTWKKKLFERKDWFSKNYTINS